MAAGPSKAWITNSNRRGLYWLRDRLVTEHGIVSKYDKGILRIEGANAIEAGYRLLRASNGEACLFPWIKRADGKFEDGFGVFNDIRKA